MAAPPASEPPVRFYGVFETFLRGAYGFVGRETDHERTHGFACTLQFRIAYITLAAVDVRERKDERLCGKGGFLLGLRQGFRRPRARPLRLLQRPRRAGVADRKRRHKRREKECGGDDSGRGEGIAPRQEPKAAQG